MKSAKNNSEYQNLVQQISSTYVQGQRQAMLAVNSHHLKTYWQVGCHIVEFEQKGKARAAYGEGLLEKLSRDFMHRYGRGFSQSNLQRMRQFYLAFPIGTEPPPQLGWSHWLELLKIDDPQERSFYTRQAILETWSVAELVRQIETSLFQHQTAARSRDEILKKSLIQKQLGNGKGTVPAPKTKT